MRGKKSWTRQHDAWVRRQRLADEFAQRALDHMLCHLDRRDAQIAVIDHELKQIATREPCCDAVTWLCCFCEISTPTALGLLAEIGDVRRLGSARELMSYIGPTASEHSSGGSNTADTSPRATTSTPADAWSKQPGMTATDHAAASANRLADRVSADVNTRAWQAQVGLHHRHRALAEHGKRLTVTHVAIARELTGFVWAAITHQPLREQTATA